MFIPTCRTLIKKSYRRIKRNNFPKMIKMLLKVLTVLLLILVLIYLLGPKPPRPKLRGALPDVPSDPAGLEEMIAQREGSTKLKPDNEARFIWANDSLKSNAEFALVYLHGFSSSWFEAYPVNNEFVRRYGCNAFYARLASHGIDTTEALADMTPDRLWESAREALAIGNRIGRKVIIMSTSTGGTLALKLAAEFPDLVHGLILYSPNVAINKKNAALLSKQWGLQFARSVYKSRYRVVGDGTDTMECRYWNCRYRLEAVVYLQQLLDATMKDKVFGQVKCPVFLGYYYRDEEHQDKVVKVEAALRMFDRLGTPETLKQKVAFPTAGDHVIACGYYSKSVDEVRQATFEFAEKMIGMIPVVGNVGSK
jgi:pimeloyl-ACP methyl ester carboxylesterase